MRINKHFLAPCGLYCGVCGVYYATRDRNEKFMERLAGFYSGSLPEGHGIATDELECEGCLSGNTSIFCSACQIRDCTRSKGYEGCHECSDFPCVHIDSFPLPVGKRVILRAIPYWREYGTENWVRDEEARYLCPDCGHMLFRGAKRCNKCKTEVDLD